MEEYELRPCPFCGSKAETDLAAGYAPQVFCTGEKCSVCIMDIDGVYLDDVIIRWNTRFKSG
jgi:hypothetical protein